MRMCLVEQPRMCEYNAYREILEDARSLVW